MNLEFHIWKITWKWLVVSSSHFLSLFTLFFRFSEHFLEFETNIKLYDDDYSTFAHLQRIKGADEIVHAMRYDWIANMNARYITFSQFNTIFICPVLTTMNVCSTCNNTQCAQRYRFWLVNTQKSWILFNSEIEKFSFYATRHSFTII